MQENNNIGEFEQRFHEHATQIGYFFNNWGVLEHLLIASLARLLATDQMRAKLVFSEFAALGSKLKLMRRLIYTYFPDSTERKALLKLIGDTQRMSDIRNRYAHAAWGLQNRPNGTKEVMILPGTAPGRPEETFLKPEMITVDEIKSDGQRLSALSERWQTFYLKSFPDMREDPQLARTLEVLQHAAESTGPTD
jgi:hypothetical protein